MSLAVFVCSSYEKINRQFPVTVKLHDPFRSPFRGCSCQPGRRRSCSSVSAVSRANRSLRSLSIIADGTPLALPSSWRCLSPLWRKRPSCMLSLLLLLLHSVRFNRTCQAVYYWGAYLMIRSPRRRGTYGGWQLLPF